MTDRPITFSAHMVRALLGGRKTQHRLPLKRLNLLRKESLFGFITGDRLWVREAVCWVSAWGWRYRADNDDLDDKRESGEVGRWRSPILMPRSASRLTLTVTDVRVQRLQDISEDDAFDEGVARKDIPLATWRAAFRDLWDDIHGPDAWDDNPWVVALTFTVEHRNIDAG